MARWQDTQCMLDLPDDVWQTSPWVVPLGTTLQKS
jgi:hypothetical protein